MENIWQIIIENLFDRLDGPLHFRFILQPLIASIFAVIDGMKDAKNDKSAYFWAVITDATHRREFLKSGWQSVGKIFILAVILDAVYQLKVFNKIYLSEMFTTALVLAIVPYLLLRGPTNRIMRLNKKLLNQSTKKAK